MKILIASSIDAKAIEILHERHDVICAFGASEEELQPLVKDRECLIFRSGVKINARVMASAPDLKLLVRAGSGIDNVDMDYVRERELELVRVPEPGAKAVSELSFAFMLVLARNLLKADHLTRQGRWAKYELEGHLLTDKVLGIIGLGTVGSCVGRMGVAWGMDVVGCVESPSPHRAAEFIRQGIRLMDNCYDVLAVADFVSIHVPLKGSTHNLIDADALAHMKPGTQLVNLARGGVVDETALRRALDEGRLRGAALDVHTNEGEGKISPLADLPNVILTPHIGSMTIDSQRQIGQRVIAIVNSHTVDHSDHGVVGQPAFGLSASIGMKENHHDEQNNTIQADATLERA